MKWISWGLVLLLAQGCVTAPNAVRPRPAVVRDPAAALQRYYDERLTPAEGGYRQGAQVYAPRQLPAFYDAMGATQSAAWARQGMRFRMLGWGLALGLVAGGAGLSAQSEPHSPAASAWWLSLLPAGMLGWTFHGIGHGWFTQPSVALYNKQLAQMLGMQVLPEREP